MLCILLYHQSVCSSSTTEPSGWFWSGSGELLRVHHCGQALRQQHVLLVLPGRGMLKNRVNAQPSLAFDHLTRRHPSHSELQHSVPPIFFVQSLRGIASAVPKRIPCEGYCQAALLSAFSFVLCLLLLPPLGVVTIIIFISLLLIRVKCAFTCHRPLGLLLSKLVLGF